MQASKESQMGKRVGFLVGGLLLVLVGTCAWALEVSLEPSEAQCEPNAEVKMEIRLSGASDLLSMGVKVIFPPEKLQVVGADKNKEIWKFDELEPDAAAYYPEVQIDNENGTVTIIGGTLTPVSGDPLLGSIVFECENAGDASVTVGLAYPTPYDNFVRQDQAVDDSRIVFTGATISQRSLSCQPNQGTIGTELIISGQGCGAKKGKLLVGSGKCKVLEWTNTSVRALLKKVPMGPGTYNITVMPKGKGLAPIVMQDAFSIVAPVIQAVTTSGNSATLTGLFFGTKKVKAYLVVDGSGKRKKLKVTSLEMNPSTGLSQLELTVSNKVLKNLEPGSYDVIVENKIGSDTFRNGVTIK
jgi:hypothetical protein